MKNPRGPIPGFRDFQFTASLCSSLCPSYSAGILSGLGLFLALVASMATEHQLDIGGIMEEEGYSTYWDPLCSSPRGIQFTNLLYPVMKAKDRCYPWFTSWG